MADQILVQIRFSVETEVGEYNDALYYSLDEYAVLTKDELEAVKSDRVAIYVDKVKNPPPEVEPTKDELITTKQALEEYYNQLTIEIAALQSAIDLKG